MDNKEDTNKMAGGIDNTGYTSSEQPPSYPSQPSHQNQQPYPGAPLHPYAGQPYAGQYYAGQYYAGQPYGGQTYPGAPYSGMQSANNTSTVVVTQAPTQSTIVVAQAAPDNLGLAIFSCLCCFWPLGLFAIFKASQSQSALARGDIALAAQMGKQAKILSLISIAVGIVSIIIVIVCVVTIPRTTYYYSSNGNYYSN